MEMKGKRGNREKKMGCRGEGMLRDIQRRRESKSVRRMGGRGGKGRR